MRTESTLAVAAAMLVTACAPGLPGPSPHRSLLAELAGAREVAAAPAPGSALGSPCGKEGEPAAPQAMAPASTSFRVTFVNERADGQIEKLSHARLVAGPGAPAELRFVREVRRAFVPSCGTSRARAFPPLHPGPRHCPGTPPKEPSCSLGTHDR